MKTCFEEESRLHNLSKVDVKYACKKTKVKGLNDA
jgi:hypothetical protein